MRAVRALCRGLAQRGQCRRGLTRPRHSPSRQRPPPLAFGPLVTDCCESFSSVVATRSRVKSRLLFVISGLIYLQWR
jgi:hypothetical protein